MFAIFGWGRKSKSWPLPDGRHIVAHWRFFHIFWCPIAFGIQWHLIGDNRSEDVVIDHEKVKELMPIETPEVGWWQRYGLLVGIFILILVLIISGAFSDDSSSTTNTSSAQSQTQTTVLNYSLSTGTILSKSSVYFDGEGKLTITNGASEDAVIKLIDPSFGRSIYSVYIKAGDDYTIEGIVDGTYKVMYASGENWDLVNKKFLTDSDYEEFEDSLDFETTDTDLTHYTLTLNPVFGGNAETDSLNPSEFNNY